MLWGLAGFCLHPGGVVCGGDGDSEFQGRTRKSQAATAGTKRPQPGRVETEPDPRPRLSNRLRPRRTRSKSTTRSSPGSPTEPAGGDVLIVTCPIDNPTPYKLVNMTLSVRCIDQTDKVVVEKTKRKLTDLGMDFAPPMQVKNHEIMVELGSIPSSSITRVEVKIEGVSMHHHDGTGHPSHGRAKPASRNSRPATMTECPPGTRRPSGNSLKLLEEKRKMTGP